MRLDTLIEESKDDDLTSASAGSRALRETPNREGISRERRGYRGSERRGLHAAARLLDGRQPRLATWLIDKGADVTARLSDGFSALHIFTKHFRNRPRNFTVTIQRNGEDVVLRDPDEIRRAVGSHPDDEHRALLECARKLLDAGVDLSVRAGPKKAPALRYAAEVDDELAMLVLDRTPDVNAADAEGFTALHMAGRGGHRSLAAALLAANASVDAADELGFTPLHEAIMAGQRELVELLLNAGANPRLAITGSYGAFVKGDTAFEIATKSKHEELKPVLEGERKA